MRDRRARGGLVLASLIAVAAVANLNLSVANVAIPDIGRDFDSSQTMLNLIAVGYSLGLAASVLLTYAAALIAVLLGAALVFFLSPRKEKELELRAVYSADDGAPAVAPPPDPLPVAAGDGS